MKKEEQGTSATPNMFGFESPVPDEECKHGDFQKRSRWHLLG